MIVCLSAGPNNADKKNALALAKAVLEPITDPYSALQGLHALQGLQGLHAAAAQGLQGLHAAAAQGLQGLQALHAASAPHGLQALHWAAAGCAIANAAAITTVLERRRVRVLFRIGFMLFLHSVYRSFSVSY